MKVSTFKTTVTGMILSVLVCVSTPLYAGMTDMRGNPASVSKYVGQGKWTIVEAWHSECGTCMKTMPELVKSKDSFPNAKLVGVSLDGDRSKAQGVIQRFKVNFPTLLTNITDFDQYVRRVANKPLPGAPTYLIFSPKGKLKAMQSGNISPNDIRNYLKKQK